VSKIKAVIFDMDGVLVDAKDWHYDALNRSLGLFGMEISRYDHLVTYDGLPTVNKLSMLSLERGLPEELHEFINDMKQQYTMEIIHAKCKPKFYHEYALSKLASDGYKMSVASNSIRDTVDIMMKKSALDQHLEFSISNEDVSNGKPDPEMYQLSMKKLGLMPNECMIVEDNENGIKAAIASKAWVMKVENVEEVNYFNIKKNIKFFEGKM